jgi:AbrB family looped-hinge helix DNA binding protein
MAQSDFVLTLHATIQVRLPRLGLTVIFLTDFYSLVILSAVNITERTETVRFTAKGQVVIPLRLRRQFEIEDGTRAVVQATAEGILLKPVTAALIKRGRGILKRKLRGKPLPEEWAEHRRHERELEERHAR